MSMSAQPPDPNSPQAVSAQYDAPINQAKARYDAVQQKMQALQDQLDQQNTSGASDPTVVSSLTSQIAGLQKEATDAAGDYATLLRTRADAVTKATANADPTVRAQAEAQVRRDKAQADLAEVQVTEYIANSGAAREQATQAVRTAKAAADTAEYNLAKAQNEDPERLRQLQAAADASESAARVAAGSEGAAISTAKANASTATSNAAVAAGSTQAQIDAAKAAATAAGANAGKAQTEADIAAQTSGNKVAQSGVDLENARVTLEASRVALEKAQKELDQSPTDEEAKQARDLALQTLQENYDQLKRLDPIAADQARATVDATIASTKASEGAERRANELQPSAIAQANATVENTNATAESTREGTKAKQQGPLYGLQQQLQQIHGLIASGQLPAELADDYLTSTIAGTTPYDAFTADRTAQESRFGHQLEQRQQDSSLQGQRIGTFGSMANQILQTVNQANARAAPRSHAAAAALNELIDQAVGRLNGFQNPAAVQGLDQNAPAFLQQYANRQPSQGAVPGARPLSGDEVRQAFAGRQITPEQAQQMMAAHHPVPSDPGGSPMPGTTPPQGPGNLPTTGRLDTGAGFSADSPPPGYVMGPNGQFVPASGSFAGGFSGQPAPADIAASQGGDQRTGVLDLTPQPGATPLTPAQQDQQRSGPLNLTANPGAPVLTPEQAQRMREAGASIDPGFSRGPVGGGVAIDPGFSGGMPSFLQNYAPGGNPVEQAWRRVFGRLPGEAQFQAQPAAVA